MFGSAHVQGRRVDFSNVGTTKMACTQPRIQRIETAFVRGLEKVDRFRQWGSSLELYDRNRLVMKLTAPTKQPPISGDVRTGLEDSKWVLDAIKGVPVGNIGRTAFLVFDKTKGSAGGNSSCNVFGGSYTASGGTLKITDVVSTMRACVEDDRMTIEREFLEGLRQANRYEIARGKLMLYRNQRLLLTLNGERK
jgi:heat shock protein HslJ